MASSSSSVGAFVPPVVATPAGGAAGDLPVPVQSRPGLLSDTPVLDSLLPVLTPDALFRLGATCRALHGPVNAYAARAFNGDALLARFFPGEVAAFRALLALTGAIVSGSAVLQLLNRVRYNESDLDVYVLALAATDLCHWLLEHGYSLGLPGELDVGSQLRDLHYAIDSLVDDWWRGYRRPELSVETLEDYEQGNSVFTFTRGTDRVQVIVCKGDVFASVLNFHSTAVRNILKYRAAYSLCPLATLRNKTSLLLYRVGENLLDPRMQEVIQRYRGRGFEMTVSGRQERELGAGARIVGDPWTWTVPQPMVDLERLLMGNGMREVPPDAIGGRRWELAQARDRPMLFVRVLDGEGFEVKHRRDAEYVDEEEDEAEEFEADEEEETDEESWDDDGEDAPDTRSAVPEVHRAPRSRIGAFRAFVRALWESLARNRPS
ncbi:hypothetical protein DFJ74DRAFT_695984 [Hyaloraphidium curvatum]|nr:hypothetical protein DFJ74DRAFT_695984 [Hyaloraphidium curvatum]